MKNTVIAVLALCAMAASSARAASGSAGAAARGGHFAWARLITPDRNWNFHHVEEDPVIAATIRAQTGLNLAAGAATADPENLAQLCRYPLIFTNNVFYVKSANARQNLVEYVRRGGFLWVDFCQNLGDYTRPPGKWDPFFDETVAWFTQVFPRAELRRLPPTSDIYRCFFTIDLELLWNRVGIRGYWPGSRHGMWGVFEDGKMIGLVGLSMVMCGWRTDPGNLVAERQKLASNIFVYAMTRTTETAAAAQRGSLNP